MTPGSHVVGNDRHFNALAVRNQRVRNPVQRDLRQVLGTRSYSKILGAVVLVVIVTVSATFSTSEIAIEPEINGGQLNSIYQVFITFHKRKHNQLHGFV